MHRRVTVVVLCVCLSVTTLAATWLVCQTSVYFPVHSHISPCIYMYVDIILCIYVCATYKHRTVYVYTLYIALRVMHFSAFIKSQF